MGTYVHNLICRQDDKIVLAPSNQEGWLQLDLADPTPHANFLITKLLDHCLDSFNVILNYELAFIDRDIVVAHNRDLVIMARGDIIINSSAKIVSKSGGNVYLKAGMGSNTNTGKVIFEGNSSQIIFENGGSTYIYYNPEASDSEAHKYHNPVKYFKNISPPTAIRSYMLINNANDLQDVQGFLHGNYALSQNINASVTHQWNEGRGFIPLYIPGERPIPFSGEFDGNGFAITDLYINSTDSDVGLFGIVAGQKNAPAIVKNLKLENCTIRGDHYVGALAGSAEYAIFENIEVTNFQLYANAVVGGVIGTAKNLHLINPIVDQASGNITALDNKYTGVFAGALDQSFIHSPFSICNEYDELKCVGFSRDMQITEQV